MAVDYSPSLPGPTYPIYVPADACNAVYSGGTWTGTDSTSVVQNAIDKAAAVNGEVLLPWSPCLISSALNVGANVTIRG